MGGELAFEGLPAAVERERQRDEAAACMARFAGQLNLVNARLTAEVASLLESGLWEQGGHTTPTGFLCQKLGLSPERAKLIVRVAGHRADFPVVMAMFDRGELSLEQAAEAVKAPAWADSKIADIVKISTPAKLRRGLRDNSFGHDPDAPDSAEPTRPDKVGFGVGRDGRWRLHAELGVEDGRRVEAALAERKDALFADDDSATLSESFVDCFDRSLDAVESQPRRDRYRTWFHYEVGHGALATTDGWRIPMAAQKHLLCDGVIQPVWESEGVPFSVGRAQHIVPDRTRRIIEKRDRGCRVPGCSSATFVEIHHIIHWMAGGPTDTWNLLSLCPKHHKMHHRGELGITGNADEFMGVEFTDSRGRPINGVDPPIPAAEPPPVPEQPYEPPLQARFNWSWIGYGWAHPNAIKKRADEYARHHARLDAERQAA